MRVRLNRILQGIGGASPYQEIQTARTRTRDTPILELIASSLHLILTKRLKDKDSKIGLTLSGMDGCWVVELTGLDDYWPARSVHFFDDHYQVSRYGFAPINGYNCRPYTHLDPEQLAIELTEGL